MVGDDVSYFVADHGRQGILIRCGVEQPGEYNHLRIDNHEAFRVKGNMLSASRQGQHSNGNMPRTTCQGQHAKGNMARVTHQG